MDGLLVNTEDIYTLCANIVLAKHGRPPLTWSIKAQLMGVPGSSTGKVFLTWAQLPITPEQFAKELSEQQWIHFPTCKPLPGAEKLLSGLKNARTTNNGIVEIALASSSEQSNYDRKLLSPTAKELLSQFAEGRLILGDDPRVQHGRGKPAPDIYWLALETINSSLHGLGMEITPEECLVFEDSIPGVEAGRRAGMRVVWVPHPGLAAEYKGREKEVLAGRTGLVKINDDSQPGEIDDGWAVQLPSLKNFPFEKFGIEISEGVPCVKIPEDG
jgi:pseudouridine 5'-phosphatase